jgi:hypothetical protein
LQVFPFGLAAFLACLAGVKSVDNELSIEQQKPRAGSIKGAGGFFVSGT